MADRAKRFSDDEIRDLTRSGSLTFLAKVTGFKSTEHFVKSGLSHGPTGHKVRAVYTVPGRRTMARNLQALSDDEWEKARRERHLHVLAHAWGLDGLRRLEALRRRGYPDQRKPTTRSWDGTRAGTATIHQPERERGTGDSRHVLQALLQLRCFITLDLLPMEGGLVLS